MEAEAALGASEGALGIHAIDAGPFVRLARGGDDPVQCLFDVGRMRIDIGTVRQGDGQVGWSDEQHVDARHRGDRLHVVERLARLDHRQRHGETVRLAQIELLVRHLAEHGGAVRAPAPFAARREFRRGDEALGVVHGVDHRHDDAFRAPVERARHAGLIVERHAHDRRGAAVTDAADRGDGRGLVPHAVLAVDRDGVEAFARQHFGDERRGEAAPAGIDRVARGEAGGEGEAGMGCHGDRLEVCRGMAEPGVCRAPPRSKPVRERLGRWTI